MNMRKVTGPLFMVLFLVGTGCASNVHFVQTDETYEPKSRPEGAEIVFSHDKIKRPHRVIGIIEAELPAKARRAELDHLLVKKAREIGAEGVMLVEYDVDRDVYVEHHHYVVGHGPWRHHVVASRPHADVKKTASGVAVVFKQDGPITR